MIPQVNNRGQESDHRQVGDASFRLPRFHGNQVKWGPQDSSEEQSDKIHGGIGLLGANKSYQAGLD